MSPPSSRPPREPSLRERALKLLAGREHSQAELRRRLAPHAESPEQLDALIADLVSRRQLSDARFAEARSQVLARKYGASRIALDLRARGVDEAEAQKAVDAARAGDLERAREIYARKYRRADDGPLSREERARRTRFLQSRGFSFDVIRLVMAGAADPDEAAADA